MAFYTKGYKYRLEGDTVIPVPSELLGVLPPVVTPHFVLTNAALTIMDGYSWDGASGPVMDRDTNMLPSLVHDCLYQMMRRGLLPHYKQEMADELFRQMCVDRGCWKWLAKTYRNALAAFGKKAATQLRKVYTMP